MEGKAIAYYTTLTDKNGIVTNGMIFGYKEDVMLALKPKSGDSVQVSGTLYLDENEQNLDLELDGKKTDLRLECGVEGWK